MTLYATPEKTILYHTYSTNTPGSKFYKHLMKTVSYALNLKAQSCCVITLTLVCGTFGLSVAADAVHQSGLDVANS